MSLGLINSIKDQSQGYLSLLLFTITLTDGTVVRLSTNPLNTTEGGYQYNGNNYLSRIQDQNLGAIQALSPLGFDVVPNALIKCADADAFLWINYERASGKGIGGARMDCDLVMVDIGATGYVYSDNAQRRFSGICDPPNLDEKDGSFTITAVSLFNMARRHVPNVIIQPRCPWIFPVDAASRQRGADDRTSPFYQCGYSPDATGGNARGNLNGGAPYITCNYTKSDCMDRGMYTKDSANRLTGRFGGSQYALQSSYFKGKQYTTGTTVDGYDANVSARYGDYFPLVYGTQNITDCPIMNVFGDPNSTRFEVVVGFGQMNVLRVVVNGVQVSQGGSDVLFTWRYTNTGTRNGSPQGDNFYNHNGDPYGSLCCIEIVVPNSLQQSSGIPKVAILAQRVDTPIPNTNNAADASSWPVGYTTNTAYILLDLLVNSGNFTYADIDLASFNAAATVCNYVISYQDLTGATTYHERYRASVYYRQPKPLSQCISNLRQSFLGILAPNSFNGGLLQLFIEQTLADQQGATIPGSNYNTAIASVQSSGTAANGYAAYSFDESNILPGSLQPKQNTLAATGNRVSFSFQDSANQWAQDSISQVNANAVAAAGNQEIDAPAVSPEGIENFDQAGRIANIQLFKNLLGNPRADAKGSLYVDFVTTVRATHLIAGHIVLLSWQRLGIVNQQFRVRSIQPLSNSEQIKISMSWHSDAWYEDAIAQIPAQLFSQSGLSVPNRDPYPWKPAGELPLPSDPIYTGPSFRLSLKYTADAAGNPNPLITVQGYPPANALSTLAFPPLVPLQGTTANTGGTIPPGNYVFAVSAQDAGTPKKNSALSNLVQVTIPSGTLTNTASIPNWFFQPNTSRYSVYFGIDESRLQYVGAGSATATSFTLNNFPATFVTPTSPPDLKFSEFLTQTFHEVHGGLWALPVTAVSGTTLTFAGQAFPSNFYQGCVLSGIGTASGSVQPLVNATVTTNDATTVTTSVDISSRVSVGDLMLMRMNLTTVGNLTIGDSKLQNTIYPSGLSVNAEAGLLLVVIAGTGVGQSQNVASNTATTWTPTNPWTVPLDATSIVVVLEPSPIEKPSDKITFDGRSNTFGPPAVTYIPTLNYAGQVLFIRVLTADANGNHGPEYLAPFREVYIAGQAGALTAASNPGYTTVTPDSSGNVTIDLASGYNQQLVLTSGSSLPVPNGDFESGVLAPWTAQTSVIAAPTVAVPHTGVYGLDIAVGTSDGSVFQDITGLTLGARYSIGAWVAVSAGATAKGFLFVHDGSFGNAVSSPDMGPGGYRYVRLTFIATSTNTVRIELGRRAGAGTVTWDDVTLSVNRVQILDPINSAGTISAAIPSLTLYVDEDYVGGWLPPLFSSKWTSDFQQQGIDGTPSTRSTFICQYHGTVWGLDSFRTGGQSHEKTNRDFGAVLHTLRSTGNQSSQDHSFVGLYPRWSSRFHEFRWQALYLPKGHPHSYR